MISHLESHAFLPLIGDVNFYHLVKALSGFSTV